MQGCTRSRSYKSHFDRVQNTGIVEKKKIEFELLEMETNDDGAHRGVSLMVSLLCSKRKRLLRAALNISPTLFPMSTSC